MDAETFSWLGAFLGAVVLAAAAFASIGVLTDPTGTGPAGNLSAPDRGEGPRFGTCINADPTGQAFSGPKARPHRAGARPVTVEEAAPPDAVLYRTCEYTYEPTLGVTRDGDLFYVGYASRTSDSPRAPLTVGRSSDGGASWQRVLTRHPSSLDPYLYVDRDTDRVFASDIDGCVELSWSDDMGQSWTTNPAAACGSVTDHQTMYAGPPVTSVTSKYPNVVYVCGIMTIWYGGAAQACAKSLDGGSTWVPTGEPAYTYTPHTVDAVTDGDVSVGCTPGSGHLFVDSSGTLYLPRGHCSRPGDRTTADPYVAISEDEGATWTRVKVADNGMPTGRSAVFGFLLGQERVVNHEAAVAADDDGNVYYFWIARDRLPYLAVSGDGGRTWDDPLMVAPPGVDQAAMPTMMSGSGGALAIAYLGTKESPGGPPFPHDPEAYANVTWNGYLTVTTDALVPDPLFWTTSANDPAHPLVTGKCGPIRCQQQADFIDVQVGPDGRPWASFVAPCEPTGPTVTSECSGMGLVASLVGGPDLRNG